MQHDAHIWARFYAMTERYMRLETPEPEVRRNLPSWLQVQTWSSLMDDRR